MNGSSKGYKQLRISDENNPVIQKIIQLLSVKPDKKKEIANECGVQLAVVHRVYKYYFSGKESEYDKMIEAEVLNGETGETEEKEESNVIEPLFKEEESNDENIVVEKGKHGRLSDDTIMSLLEYVKDHTVVEACEKFKVSNFTVYKYCNEYGVKPYTTPYENRKKKTIVITGGDDNMKRRNKKKEYNRGVKLKDLEKELVVAKTTEQSEEEVIDTIENVITPEENTQEKTFEEVAEVEETVEEEILDNGKEITRIGNFNLEQTRYASAVSVALIYDRHSMPVSTGIFNTEIPNEHLFDYPWYDGYVNNWLTKNIPVDDQGVPEKGLLVYITGLPAATASVIKCCANMKINISLMHYNYEKKGFVKQDIFTDFPVVRSDNGLSKLFEGDIVLTKEGTSIYDFENTDVFFVISKKRMIGSQKYGNANYQTIEHYVVPDYPSIWELYPALVEQIMADTSEKISLFVNEVHKDKNLNQFFFGKTITKSWNFNMNI